MPRDRLHGDLVEEVVAMTNGLRHHEGRIDRRDHRDEDKLLGFVKRPRAGGEHDCFAGIASPALTPDCV